MLKHPRMAPPIGKENDPWWIAFCKRRNEEAATLDWISENERPFTPVPNRFKVDGRSWLAKLLNL